MKMIEYKLIIGFLAVMVLLICTGCYESDYRLESLTISKSEEDVDFLFSKGNLIITGDIDLEVALKVIENVNTQKLVLMDLGISKLPKLNTATLEELSIYDYELSSISNIEECQNLKSLFIWSAKYIDFNEIGQMQELVYLDLRGNRTEDISFISNLEKLEFLDLSHNNIQDIEDLKNLVNLKEVNLNFNNISSLEPIKNSIRLKKLFLYQNGITSLEYVSNLCNLEILYMGHNCIDPTTDNISIYNNLVTIGCDVEICWGE